MAMVFMVPKARLHNSWLCFICLGLFGCQTKNHQKSVVIPSVFVAIDQPDWQQKEGKLLYKNTQFDGWQYQLHANGDTAFVGAFLHGKPEGTHTQRYENKQLKEVRHYENGWQEGTQQGWYADGKPRFLYKFKNDVYQGIVKQWYPSGRLSVHFNYEQGQEAGRQQMWYSDGNLKANYVARNGRNYGLTGVKNCENVWDSVKVSD